MRIRLLSELFLKTVFTAMSAKSWAYDMMVAGRLDRGLEGADSNRSDLRSLLAL